MESAFSPSFASLVSGRRQGTSTRFLSRTIDLVFDFTYLCLDQTGTYLVGVLLDSGHYHVLSECAIAKTVAGV